MQRCRECYACWIKTPGRCVIDDGLPQMGDLLGRCDELVILSRLTWGGYSPAIQAVWERSIPSMLPYFNRRNSKCGHPMRALNRFALKVLFYSGPAALPLSMAPISQGIAKDLVRANARNFHCRSFEVLFFDSSAEALEGLT
jgi:hypothetical protein